MKTIFTVLVLAALGAGAYFYFSKKHSASADPKELLAGKWKIDSVNLTHSRDSSLALAFLVSDSNLHNYEFDMNKKGLIIQSLNGRTEDTSLYEMTGGEELLIWRQNDSVKSKWRINTLDSLNLVIQGKDSAVFTFKKISSPI